MNTQDYILARFLNGIFLSPEWPCYNFGMYGGRFSGKLCVLTLTTISENTENCVEPLCRKGSTQFGQFASKLCNTNETLANQVFSILRPDNSDSEGRWFESSWAYQSNIIRTKSSLWEMGSDYLFLRDVR